MNFREWLNSRNGRPVDVDGWYGAQCWDSWSDYATAMFGVPTYTTGTGAGGRGTHRPGYACEVYHQFDRSGLNRWFTRYPANVRAQPGDAAFWEWGSPEGPMSHVAIVVEDRGSHIYCMTQNPRPNGYATLSKAGLLGYLRPDNQAPFAGFGGSAPAPTAPNQRQVGSEPVNRRLDPNTSRAPIPEQLMPGEVGNFTGWIRGENVSGNDVWFRGISGNWFWSGGFTSQSTDGLEDLNPKAQPTKPNQRQVAGTDAVRRRREATTSSQSVEPLIAANTVVNVIGWINGEAVNGNPVWFKAEDGFFSWSGAFTSQSTEGITDLNAKPEPAPTPTPTPTPVVDPKERTLGGEATYRRPAPNRGVAPDATLLQPGEKIKVSGWITGESVNGIATWYKIEGTELYSWAGAFTSQSIDGILDLNPSKPEGGPDPVTPSKSVKDRIPNWDGSANGTPVFPRPVAKGKTIKLPETSIVEQTAAVSTNGYTIGRPELASSVGLGPVNHFVLHHAASTSLTGVVNTLSGNNGAPTATYAVKDRYLVGMVPEEDTAWTNGRWTSNCHSITFEMCNEGGSSSTGWLAPSGATCETVAWAMARAAIKWQMEPLEYGINVFGHKDVSKSATACPGSLDIPAVVKRANEIIAQYSGDEPEPTPTPEASDKDKQIAEVITEVQEDLGKIVTILEGEK